MVSGQQWPKDYVAFVLSPASIGRLMSSLATIFINLYVQTICSGYIFNKCWCVIYQPDHFTFSIEIVCTSQMFFHMGWISLLSSLLPPGGWPNLHPFFFLSDQPLTLHVQQLPLSTMSYNGVSGRRNSFTATPPSTILIKYFTNLCSKFHFAHSKLLFFFLVVVMCFLLIFLHC